MLLREQLAIVRAHQNKAPVQTVPIAHDLGIEVYRTSGWPDNISGLIRKDAEKGGASGYAIFVNANHPRVRRRFTIAHEIAHFIMHGQIIGDGIVEDELLRAAGLSNRIEAQANSMAADILMPRQLIRKEQERGIVTIEALAEKFDVSRDAMSYRLIGISYGLGGPGNVLWSAVFPDTSYGEVPNLGAR